MTGVEITALVESALKLAVRIVELATAASKGDVTAAETLKKMTEHSDSMKAVAVEAHAYLDEKFEKP